MYCGLHIDLAHFPPLSPHLSRRSMAPSGQAQHAMVWGSQSSVQSHPYSSAPLLARNLDAKGFVESLLHSCIQMDGPCPAEVHQGHLSCSFALEKCWLGAWIGQYFRCSRACAT